MPVLGSPRRMLMAVAQDLDPLTGAAPGGVIEWVLMVVFYREVNPQPGRLRHPADAEQQGDAHQQGGDDRPEVEEHGWIVVEVAPAVNPAGTARRRGRG